MFDWTVRFSKGTRFFAYVTCALCVGVVLAGFLAGLSSAPIWRGAAVAALGGAVCVLVCLMIEQRARHSDPSGSLGFLNRLATRTCRDDIDSLSIGEAALVAQILREWLEEEPATDHAQRN